MADSNPEALQKIAIARYGRDLQGAMKRLCITDAGVDDALAVLELNGLCRALYGKEAHQSHNEMAFSLTVSPAP